MFWWKKKRVDKISKLLKPIIILYKPQLGENIGFVARAMRNCGVDDLRLIDPRDGWPNPLSYKVAKSGTHVLEKIKVFNKFIEAVKDVDYLVACSARKRNLSKETWNLSRVKLYAAPPCMTQNTDMTGRHVKVYTRDMKIYIKH